MNLDTLYRLPWTATDNPNGWIEPTTHCQLKCPGCYRGLDTGKIKFTHETLEHLKAEVDRFIKERNVQTISIAGGEPTMFPYINDIIAYISSKGLATKLYTNGILINKKSLKKLKESGLTEAAIHIDMFQDRKGWIGKNEAQLNELRQYYVDMFREEGGVNLGFVLPLGSQNIIYLKEVLDFYRRNIDVIALVVLNVFRDVHEDNKNTITQDDIVQAIGKHTLYSPCTYLPKTKNTKEFGWLISNGFGNTDGYFGDMSSAIYKKYSDSYYKKRGRYFLTKKHKPLSKFSLFPLLLYTQGRKIFKNIFFSQTKKPLYNQTILIIDPPSTMGDWCQGCPDMMYVDGKIFPSCMASETAFYRKTFFIE